MANALTQPPTATTCTFVPSVPARDMLAAVVPHPARNKAVSPNVHWERCPRFVRDFVWSDVDSRDLTTALISEAVPPVPHPPQNELLSKEKWNVIKTCPHLFRITTPINVNRFHELLTSHPNRALVESVCEGLRTGFWPWAVTEGSDAPSVVGNAILQKVKNQGHLDFMREQQDEEIRLG